MAFRIRKIEMFSLTDMMFINADTMVALQIFRSESHPNSHMQGSSKSTSGAKESLSVFGLFQSLTYTPQGKMKLRKMFLQPSLDREIIEERQGTVSIFLQPRNKACLDSIVKSLKRIKNIQTAVVHLQKGTSGTTRGALIQGGIWSNLREFAYHALHITEALKGFQEAHMMPIVTKVRFQQ